MSFYNCLHQAARAILREVPNTSMQLSRHIKSCNPANSLKFTASVPTIASFSSLSKLNSDGLQSTILRGISAASVLGPNGFKFGSPVPSFLLNTHAQRVQGTTDVSVENHLAPSGVSVVGSEDDDEEGVLPYNRKGKKKRSKLKDVESIPTVAGLEEKFDLLSRSDRHQPCLQVSESKFIWSMAQRLAHEKKLVRTRIGTHQGLCASVLDGIGMQLKSHEIIRVDVPAATGLDVKFMELLLPDLLDCVVVKVKGRTLTLYRDARLPPVRSRKKLPDAAFQDLDDVVKMPEIDDKGDVFI
jgi:RNA-binding protein YhbY